ncbi:MAG: ubiquitin-like domain-containing protein [Chloroflexota bacterium]
MVEFPQRAGPFLPRGKMDYNHAMRKFAWLAIVAFLTACQPATTRSITILDGDRVQTVSFASGTAADLLSRAGLSLSPADRVLADGQPVALDQPLDSVRVLQIRRAVSLTLLTPDGQSHVLRTAAFTVGEALNEAGIRVGAADRLDPPADTPIRGALTVTYAPARDLSVAVNGRVVQIRSSAATVGQALAEAGIPLIGLDYSLPSENEPLPADGQIRVVQVSESLTLALESIPFTTETIQSPEVAFGVQEVVQPGQAGLAISRVRIRYEDGREVSRITESESVVRPPQTRIVNTGTQVTLTSTTVDGVNIQYWYVMQMYATSYSPCRSGVEGQCFTGTASGLPVQKGVVAMYRDWFNAMQGMEVYVPGYGRAVIADLGGGFPDGRAWIDLGFSDDDYEVWSGWVTVYFLAPAPASIPWVLQ